MKDKILKSVPIRREDVVNWKREGNIVVITYDKDLSRIEEWIRRKIGGSEIIRRPLDQYTTFIWEKCNGENSIADIIREFDNEFGEIVAPAGARVIKFLEKMLEINVVRLKS